MVCFIVNSIMNKKLDEQRRKKDEASGRSRKWYVDNIERAKERNRQYYLNHREAIIEKNRLYTEAHMDEKRRNARRYYHKNKEKVLKYTRAYMIQLRGKILTHYGKGKLACLQCGFTDIRALSIDHIKGSGNQHRKTVKNLYHYLQRNNLPGGYQTLCMNCQFIKKQELNEHRWKSTGLRLKS